MCLSYGIRAMRRAEELHVLWKREMDLVSRYKMHLADAKKHPRYWDTRETRKVPHKSRVNHRLAEQRDYYIYLQERETSHHNKYPNKKLAWETHDKLVHEDVDEDTLSEKEDNRKREGCSKIQQQAQIHRKCGKTVAHRKNANGTLGL